MKSLISLLALSCLLIVNADSQFVQQGNKLFGTGGAGLGGNQGGAVAVSADGNTLLVGSIMDSPAGAVWVFTRTSGIWTQQGDKLVGAGYAGVPQQGTGVALSADGNTALVGGYYDNSGKGAAWVFTRVNGTWGQQGTKLVGLEGTTQVHQGVSVALSADGNTAIVGGNNDNAGVGAVWIFTRSGGAWTQEGDKLIGSGAVGASAQGTSVDLSGDGLTAIAGGPGDDRATGAAWVFTRTNGTWSQQGSKLVGSDSSLSPRRGSGVALSYDGNTAAIGGPMANSAQGGVCIFVRTGGVWSQEGPRLVGSGASASAQQGCSVSLAGDGNTLLEGGYRNSDGEGAAWVFERKNGGWVQTGTPLVGTGATGLAGQGNSAAVSADGNTLVIGGYSDAGSAGATWVFVRGSASAVDHAGIPPEGFLLEQNYPNPFNPSTLIGYQIPAEGHVTLKVYDLLGREVAMLVNERKLPGRYEATFDASTVAAGLYFYRLTSGGHVESRKMLLIR